MPKLKLKIYTQWSYLVVHSKGNYKNGQWIDALKQFFIGSSVIITFII